MSEFVEIDFDSKYMLISKKPLSPGEHEHILYVWRDFVKLESPALLVVDGTEFELIKKEE